MLTRHELLAAIQGCLEPLAAVDSLFEAGSSAFGRADVYSDIDLTAVVSDGSEDEVFAQLEAALGQLVLARNPDSKQPILTRKIIPQPAFHGMAQRFYRLDGLDEWLILDVTLRPLSKPGHFAERERHGEPQILFDKSGSAQACALDQSQWKERLAGRVIELRENLELFGNFAEKECRRGHPLDALAMYHAMLLRPLAEMLRIRHDPLRHDFGLRYLDHDLPSPELARLRELAFPQDLEDLLAKQASARQWLQQLLQEHDS